MPQRCLEFPFLAAIALVAVACSGTPGPELESPLPDGADACLPVPAHAGELTAPWLVVDPQTGCGLTAPALDARLAEAGMVYLGESHDQVAHHQFQSYAIERLAAVTQGRVWVGFEMFRPDQQPVLDQWSRGEITQLGAFVDAVDWAGSWGMDVALYAPLLYLGPREAVHFVGLNAHRSLTRRVAKVGLAGLEPHEREALPPTIDTSNADYRAWLVDLLVAHHPPPADGAHGFDAEAAAQFFFEAQLVWDETMAHNMATRLAEARNHAASSGVAGAVDRERGAIVVGSGHLRHRWGIPDRFQREWATVRADDAPLPDLVIICRSLGDAADEPVELDPARADLYCLTAPTEVAPDGRP